MQEWCVYTNKIIDNNQCNIEHIIPKSIGGHNKLTIKVDKVKNSELGNLLDCKITDHPFMLMKRNHFNLRGYSKKPVKYIWNGNMNGLKGTIDLRNQDILFKTFRNLNKYGLNVSKSIRGENITSEISYDENTLISFGAKLVLGIGKYLYGDIFKKYGFHNELRDLMNSENSLNKMKFIHLNPDTKRFWIVNPLKYLDTRVKTTFEPWMNEILSQSEKHVIFTMHTRSEIIVGISLFGSTLDTWICNIGKNSLKFPIGGNFELGRVIEINLKTKEFLEIDLRSYLENYLSKKKPSII